MPTGYSSQAGHILVGTQTVQGTYLATLATTGIAIPLRSGSLGTDRDLLIPDPEISGGRDIQTAYLGAVKWSGDYEFYARIDSLLPFLKAAMGTASLNTVTGITTHTITPSDAAALPFLSIEEQIGGAGLECFSYTDAVVNSLHLEADANGYLMGTAGMIALKQIAGVTPTSVTALLDPNPLTVGTNITFTYNAVTLPAKSFKFDFNNNYEDSDFRLGSFYLASAVPKRREVTLSVDIREQDNTLWRQAAYGLSAATAPGGVVTSSQAIITMTTYENMPSGTPVGPFVLTITIPKVILKPFSFGVSGDDIIDDTIDMQAVRPLLATPICTVTAKTNRALVP